LKKTRSTITIDDDVLTEIKLLAVKEKVNFSVIIERALIKYLDEVKENTKKKSK